MFYENQPGARPMKIGIDTLLKFSREIACGMEYLASRKVNYAAVNHTIMGCSFHYTCKFYRSFTAILLLEMSY